MSAITALVQRMKLAASLATQGEWSYARSGFNSIVQVPVALLRGGHARVVLCKLFRSEWRSELNTAHDAAFIALAKEQPVPVVPDEMYWQDAPVEGSTRAAAYATGWNACRAAMLQGSQPVSNLDELPNIVGWDRPTPKSDLRQLAEKIADDVRELIKRLPDADQGGA